MEIVIGLAILAFLIGLVVAVANDKLVFYNSFGDLALSFAPWGVMLLGGIVVGIMAPEQAEVSIQEWQAWKASEEHYLNLFIYVGLAVAAGVAVRSVFINEGIFSGLLVAPFKVIYALVLPLVALAAIHNIFGKDKSLTTRALWVTLFGLVWWLTSILINGEEE